MTSYSLAALFRGSSASSACMQAVLVSTPSSAMQRSRMSSAAAISPSKRPSWRLDSSSAKSVSDRMRRMDGDGSVMRLASATLRPIVNSKRRFSRLPPTFFFSAA